MSYSRTHTGLLLLALLNACVRNTPAHLTSLEEDPIANQSAPQSCIATGPAAIPSEPNGGLHEGPHSLIVNGVRLWYCVAGTSTPDTPPAVFLHGGPGQGSFHFAALVGPQLEPGLRMVYLDQRGSGRSERPWTDEYSMQVLIEDIEELRRALGVPQIALIGHSFGGALALEYAAEYPDHVSRAVIAGGFSNADTSGRSQCERLAEVNPEAYARATTAENDERRTDPGVCNIFQALAGPEREAFFRANMFPIPASAMQLDSVDAASGLRNTGEIGRALFRAGLGQWRFTAHDRLTMPVLVIAGFHDYQIGLRGQQELADDLPNAQLVVYDRGGHFMYLDEPERFARDVVGFLSASTGPTPEL